MIVICIQKKNQRGKKEVNVDICRSQICFPALVLQKGQVQHGDLPEGAAGLDMVTSLVLLKCRN